jgi:hypothetical protein
VALDQAEEHEGQDGDADLGRQQQAADDLHAGLVGARDAAQAAAARGGKGGREGREEPEADHHHRQDVVVLGEVARDAVLEREDRGGQDHKRDPEARVLAGHACISRPSVVRRVGNGGS